MSPSFWRFLRYARPYWHICLGSVFCGVLKFSLALLLPGALGLVVKYTVESDLPQEQKLAKLALILAALIVAFLLRAPITYLRTWFAELAGNRAIFDIRSDLYRHIQRLSIAYHANRRTGSTISRLVNDINAAQGILDRGVITAAVDVLFLAGVVVFLFWIDWLLALVSLITLPLYGVLIAVLNPRMRKASAAIQEEVSEMSGEVTEKLSGLPVVLSFVREKTEELNFFARHRRYFSQVLRRVHIESLLITGTEFLTAAGPLVVIAYGGYRVITGSLDLYHLVWFYGFISHLYLPTRRLADCAAIVQERLAAMDRVFEVFDEKPDIVDAPDARPLRNPIGEVSFRAVDFAYVPGRPVLRGIEFTAHPGQRVAIVGRSGAGKSTLVNLVPRFYDVTGGRLCVDGEDVRSLQIKSLREHIGIVMQDSILFNGTIRENILYGRHGATEADMVRAAHMAHVDEFADELPLGYDTVIGERGVKLSGGQKQRISIARAFLRDPRILILDEATSSLDSHAENIIQDALEELMQGRTTLIIAHRLSTVIDCDQVIVLEDGRIVQQGTHEELIQVPGVYRNLCEEQFGYIRLETLGRNA
jgi:subfamily B ATP-binding cassette protein MsbA